MSDFRQLSETVFASPQIDIADLETAKAAGVTLIVNNRPDGEEPSAPQGAEIEAAANALGLDYVAIPIDHSGFSHEQIDAMGEAIKSAEQSANGATLAYCRSGTRSTLLWALAQAKAGQAPEAIARAGMEAGYDVSPIRTLLESLSRA